MVCVIVKAALLVHLLHTIAEVSGQSACTNYFWYFRDEGTNEVVGFVEIPSPPRGVTLDLSVSLSIAVALPSKYVGRLELAQSKEESVRAVNEGRSLRYKIHFPLPQPIPVVTGIRFNGQYICSGPRATGQIVTSIVLNHTLYPPGIYPQDQGNMIANIPFPKPVSLNYPQPVKPPDYYPGPQSPPFDIYPQPNPPPAPKPTYMSYPSPRPITVPPAITSAPPVNTQVNNNLECGRSAVKGINPLVAKGTKTSHGQWPWLVAIFVVRPKYEFQCEGTLVTNNHVITAAHCFQLNNANLPTGVLEVSLGRYRLWDFYEEGSRNMEVAEYRLHPDYDASGNADADLAVIFLRETVQYTRWIRPICLWSGPRELEPIINKVGYVVGWGRDENGNLYLEEPRMIKSPVVSHAVCFWSNQNFVSFTSNRTFCAGLKDGSGPCNGDSGSGFVMYDPKAERYYLRGVVSGSLLDSTTMSCDLSQYVVYVDVAQHLDWIRKQIYT